MSSTQKTLIKLFVVLLLSGSALFLPNMLNTPDETLINPIQARVVALFIFAALMWILEVIPIWTTSVLVITLTLLGMSNQSLNFLQVDRYDTAAIKEIISDAYGPNADQETVAKTEETVLADLKKQTSLTPAYVRTTINNTVLAPVVKGKVEKGSVILNGKDVTNFNPKKVRDAGLAHIPEDRNKRGLNRAMSIVDNLIAVRLDEEPFSKNMLVTKAGQDTYAEEMVKQFDIRPTDYNLPTSALSGGNAQKVVVAREVSMNKPLLIASQPTRGVDVGAIEIIRNTLEKAKKEGAGVLLVSAELEEIISLSDRIVVIHEGKITGELLASEANENNLGLLMMGGKEHK